MYDLTPLFWYRPLFMTELIIAESIFCVKLKRQKNFLLRFMITIALCYAVSFAFPIAFYNAAWCTFMFGGMFIFTVVLAKTILFEESFSNILFCCIAGYLIQHLAYEINDMGIILLGFNGGAPLNSYGSTVGVGGQDIHIFEGLTSNSILNLFLFFLSKNLLYFGVYILIYFLAWHIFGSKLKRDDILQLKTGTVLIISSIVLVIIVVFSSIVTYSADNQAISSNLVMIYIYNIVCCMLALYVQFELPRRTKLKQELDTANRLRYHEQEQYRISRENIELINLKCHDMRHQIHSVAMRSEINPETVEEIEQIISIYDSMLQTGNRTLDTIFTDKSLICQKKNIRFDCMVDGKSLRFINDADLCSLFGNMIENAMEAVSPLEQSARVISLSVCKRGEMLSINMRNPFTGVIKKKGDTYLTSKDDSGFHGYGLKSIRMICEKYNGEMSINTKNNIFDLSIIFPLPRRG